MVVVSNGFGKFHMACAAAELDQRGLLSTFITGAYPTPMVKRILHTLGLERQRKLNRLLARHEAIDQQKIEALWSAELLYETARQGTMRLDLDSFYPAAVALSFRYYGYRATRLVRRAANQRARLYHYRAGFGHRSVRTAKRHSMVTLCDHSIAHPALLGSLVEQNGRMPPPDQTLPPMDGLWASILTDIQRADHVLVNSEFVRTTFLHQGWDPKRVSVVYLGVDNAFLDSVPKRGYRTKSISTNNPLHLLFAGALEKRKGAETLLSAIATFDSVPWQLTIAGSIDPTLHKRYAVILGDPRVTLAGTLARTELAQTMSKADVFLFPSLAEGSARVVFEAMACGCYIVTTPNTGSIVQDGTHGALIPPGNSGALARALETISADYTSIARVGRTNAVLVRRDYTQERYGQQLAKLYASLIRSG